MPDPLSVTAGVVGIAAAAIHSIHKLKDCIKKISEAPETLRNITQDLSAVETVLERISSASEDSRLPDELKNLLINEKLKSVLKDCEKRCEKFQNTVDNWMKHSSNDKVFWWDKVRAGYFGEAKIKTFVAQLDAYKATITMALSTVTFISCYRQMQTTEQMQQALGPALKEREREIKLNEETARNQIAVVDQELEQLSVIGVVEEPADREAEQSKAELIAEVKEYRDLLDGLRDVSAAAAATTQQEGLRQKIGDLDLKKSRLLVGLVNVDTKGRTIEQEIVKVKAEDSSGAIGVIELKDPAAFQALWGTPSSSS
ncbi:hypothetical protein LTR70_010306 [Exophiala xenobiotica]|uniref:Azaphilone pigments biosynthesis cluster protein L N-terminal domain-containing protein n=1 Tax=Lithohypha guttulata TaxID=1690604 RepID=A0ABR0JW98_9EURO|nr:hypothetical protein LTR24_009713 [Lithohypha guttulata]KAK5309415.1 hypothetical protein LTR70_010306 [Exophiala xenobiotica]